jgi:hypothetical protein
MLSIRLAYSIVDSIMTYGRRGTVDVTRFSYDVLDNVVVRDGFRHDGIFTM